MEKRKGVSKLIVAILLLMILMIYIVTSVELYKAGEPERERQHYNQLIAYTAEQNHLDRRN